MTEEPHMLWANPRQVRCGFAQGFFRKRKCRCEGRYPPEGGKAGKTYPPAPVCALGHPPLGKGGLPGCRGRQPLRRKDSARRSDPQGCPDPPLCWVQDPSSALPPQDDSAARCAGRRGHPEERETRDVPSSAHPHAVTTGTSSVIRLAGDCGCHLPRARGRLEAGVRKGVARPYGGDGTRRSSPPRCPDPTLRRGARSFPSFRMTARRLRSVFPQN